MSTQPTTPQSSTISLTLPLTPEQRSVYENLYNSYEAAIENTIDVGVLEALNASQASVESVLNNDAEYRVAANTELFGMLLMQIKSTNANLKALQAQILTISTDVSTFGEILAAITKVLSLVPIA